MNRTILSLLLVLALTPAFAQTRSRVWCPDLGNGTYRNPVINADYSDPDVVCVGDDYYLTASSFQCMPGLPILHSRDLVNWSIVGHALHRLFPDADAPEHGNGVWAPSIRFHDGMFYIYWGDPDRGIFMVKTHDPAATWDEPVLVVPGSGMIDATPLWDDSGRCYLVNAWANSRCGINSVLTVRELSADGTHAIGQPVIVFDGAQENHTTEGPKFYQHDGWYWIFCPAGGVEQGWQLAMRSRSPYGPYEWKRVLAQGNTPVNGPHQGAWVHTALGEDWFLHFQDRGCYGRVVHLQPLSWRDGWPVIGRMPTSGYCGSPCLTYRKPATRQPVAIVNPAESDEFDQPRLGMQWQWQSDYRQTFGMPTSQGVLRLYTHRLGNGSLWQAPNLLLQKTPAERFTATAKLSFSSKGDGQYGGIVMMGRDYSALVVRREGNQFLLQRLTALGADEGAMHQAETLATLPPSAQDTIPYAPALHLYIYMRMRVRDGACSFSYSLDGRRFHDAGPVFRMRQGKWVGARMGFVSEETGNHPRRGWLDADWWHVE